MRDIAKDRAILAAAAPGVWEVSHCGSHDGYDVEGPEPGLHGAFAHEEDALFCVTAHNELVPHYLARCEHLERMVDAAVEYMTYGTDGFECGMCGLCPLANTDCRAITAADCKKLVRRYLAWKAKEGVKDDR